MPNDASDIIHSAEHWVEDEIKAFVAAVDREWVVVRPDAITIGKTTASIIMTAAVAYFTGGATASQAIASIIDQLPAELKAIEHVAVTLFGLAVADMKAKQAAGQAA